ncbi:MAG TPA: chemotaxis protein CheW [Methylibium sp.]|nr:chemotaxis protein CheW [Methylibium sp.]
MARREALRELQSRLAERLQGARSQAETAAWLAVEAGGQGLLLPLGQAGEIFPLAPLVPVPHTLPWFLGVANLRGRLHGVVDLATFLGLRGAARGEAVREQARLVAFNPALDCNCALLVDRLLGLRSQEQLRADQADDRPRPAFAAQRLVDASGRRWQELQLAELAADEVFLRIAR